VDDLDRIPWKHLTHAYGSAEDVPGLLRALRKAPPDLQGEESPLWQLFGNIWHQGTVYPATAYAVPFLIDMAADPDTPDRVGVLALLAEIAKGSSYRDAHGNVLNEKDFQEKLGRELEWVKACHEAVAKGFRVFVEITKENTDVRFSAAQVLAQLPEHGAEAASIIRGLLKVERRSAFRAGALFLLGQTKDGSEETRSVLTEAINDTDVRQRRAAALAIATLKLPSAREAIIETYLAEDLEECFEGLPWDAWGEIKPDELIACLDASDREQIADDLITALETGQATRHGVETLINLLFPPYKKSKLIARDLSAQQMRAVRALYEAMKGGKRISCGYFPCWGLPDTMREWRDLAAGRDPTSVDESLPILASPETRRPLPPKKLRIGQKVLHRDFGMGTVAQINIGDLFTEMVVIFQEEGEKRLSLRSESGLP
jgi:hypothetical protein